MTLYINGQQAATGAVAKDGVAVKNPGHLASAGRTTNSIFLGS